MKVSTATQILLVEIGKESDASYTFKADKGYILGYGQHRNTGRLKDFGRYASYQIAFLAALSTGTHDDECRTIGLWP